MARTETFSTLLDRASSPVQTHIILAQLAMLRKLDKARLNQQGMSTPAMLAAMVVATFTWVVVSKIVALQLSHLIPFGH